MKKPVNYFAMRLWDANFTNGKEKKWHLWHQQLRSARRRLQTKLLRLRSRYGNYDFIVKAILTFDLFITILCILSYHLTCDFFIFVGYRLATCIQKQYITNTCDEFIHQDCNYDLGEVSLEAKPGTIADASHCQALCGIFINSLGCRYWVFKGEHHTPDKSTHCTLYKTASSIYGSCNAIHGPKSPFHDECGPRLN